MNSSAIWEILHELCIRRKVIARGEAKYNLSLMIFPKIAQEFM